MPKWKGNRLEKRAQTFVVGHWQACEQLVRRSAP
jgi:hypothetical protein